VLKRKSATVNNALAAVDDLYIRRGLGPASAARAELPRTAPKALSTRTAVRFLREAQKCLSPCEGQPEPRARQIGALAAIGLRLAHLLAQRLGMHPEIRGDMRDRSAALKRQPDAASNQLIGILLRSGHNECFLL